MIEMLRAVDDVLDEIGAGEQPRLLVLNKADALDAERRLDVGLRHPDAVLVSALTGEGIDELGERIQQEFERSLADVELLLPYSEGARLAELHDLAGDLLEREDTRRRRRSSAPGCRARSRSATRRSPSTALGRPERRWSRSPGATVVTGVGQLVHQRHLGAQKGTSSSCAIRSPAAAANALGAEVLQQDADLAAVVRIDAGRARSRRSRRNLAARPERGRTRPATPGGIASARPVGTFVRRAGRKLEGLAGSRGRSPRHRDASAAAASRPGEAAGPSSRLPWRPRRTRPEPNREPAGRRGHRSRSERAAGV